MKENNHLQTATVPEEKTGIRLDVFAAEAAGITRSAAAKLISAGNVLVNSGTAAKNLKLSAGDTVEVMLPPPVADKAEAEDIPLDIIFEDSDIIIVNKPVGMVVHPAAGNPDGTLVNALLSHCGDSLSGIGGVFRPGIVHRIDKDTSGLITVAKNDFSHLSLSSQLKDHSMRRTYRAIAVGGFREDSGTVDAPIGRNPNDRKKMAVIRDPEKHARNAVTHFEVKERLGGFTCVGCRLETGRTHQIRVHLAYIGHPLMGDLVYGGGHTAFEKANHITHQILHAEYLTLTHPRTGEEMTFYAPLPDYFTGILENLRKKYVQG